MNPSPVKPLEIPDSSNRGQPLIGTSKYRLDFEPGALPPVYDSWSISIYDAQTHANEIERTSIGAWSEGLVHGIDGSLSLYLQHSPPTTGTSNWIPTPAGSFVPVLRLYETPAEDSEAEAREVHLFILTVSDVGGSVGVVSTRPGATGRAPSTDATWPPADRGESGAGPVTARPHAGRGRAQPTVRSEHRTPCTPTQSEGSQTADSRLRPDRGDS